MSNVEEVTNLLRQWEEQNNTGQDVTATLMRLADVFEKETETFLKQDPDPFDDRHPSRLQPDCTFGLMLKTFFRNEKIVDEIVKVYCQRDVLELNVACCRLLLDILPGLESVIFQEEGFVPRLLQWAEDAPNPLKSYAVGLLAAAMDTPEIAANYRERNAYFVPLMLRRLHSLSQQYLMQREEEAIPERPFACLGNHRGAEPDQEEDPWNGFSRKAKKRKDGLKSFRFSPFPLDAKVSRPLRKASLKASPVKMMSPLSDCSNSSWSQIEQYVIGSYQVYPLTLAAEQRFILQYLTPMGEYQDLLGHVVEENALSLISQYIDIEQNSDVRLAFEALKYLASLLCHKKAVQEFLGMGGLQLLLRVPYPSIAATGVSICLYYLAHIEEAMEKICSLPPNTISELVEYALWLLECSHDSSRCHATMFFGYAFQFHNILENFDLQDGLRKLFNVMSTLDIFVALDNARNLSDDQVFANRQTTRHVCGALKRYFEAHLVSEVGRHAPRSEPPKTQAKPYKAMDLSGPNIEACMETWRESFSPFAPLRPVEQFVALDGVSFLLDLITSYDVSYSGRAETIKNALDVLKICSLTSQTQMMLTEKIPGSDHQNSVTCGVLVLLQAAHGELTSTPEIQKSALHAIINCVCTKEPEADPAKAAGGVNPKKKSGRSVEECLSKLWRVVQNKNGIIILINLLSAKTPLTDADAIRALACKALCGLSRSETVKQIVSKLPLITEGQLLDLTREPVLPERAAHHHVEFCRHAFELIERVTGAPLPDRGSVAGPIVNINKSEIVARTKVVYNELQLLHLIADHLTAKGFSESAAVLQKEINNKQCLTNGYSTPNRSLLPSTRGFAIPPSTPTTPSIPPPSVPLRIVVNRKPRAVPDTVHTPSRLQKPQACSGSYVQSPAMRRGTAWGGDQPPSATLDSIVTEYLRKQHALCKNPMLACPPFDLFAPHRCPESRRGRNADGNFLLRLHKKQMSYLNGGHGGASLDRKLIYSKFRLLRTFRDEDCAFTCTSFLKWRSERPQQRLLIGTGGGLGSGSGQLKAYQLSGEEELSRDAHSRGVGYIESSKFNPLLITTDSGRNAALWSASENFEIRHNFPEIQYMEFGKVSDCRAVGTRQGSAVIVDTSTCVELDSFPSAELGNGYMSNRATFDYSDELILTDGLIYDVRSAAMVHKLDKFNATMNGVFHPNGREIISNTEVWDMRTFKLLRTVVSLDQCEITFNEAGSVIYGIYCFRDVPDEKMHCFYTFNAYDYSPIATVDVKRPIFSLSVDRHERHIATVESQSTLQADPFLPPLLGVDCVSRLYEIGRTKEEGDEDGEESDDSEEESDDDDENDDDENDDGQNDASFQVEGEDDFSDTSDDVDEDTLFSLNSSMED